MSNTILLVDDDAPFRESVRDILEIEGYQVIECGDGKEALPILEKQQIDLMITDILMPEIEGIELVSKTKKIKPTLNIIGMTGGGRMVSADKVRKMCLPVFFGPVLNKPFLQEELLAQVSDALATL